MADSQPSYLTGEVQNAGLSVNSNNFSLRRETVATGIQAYGESYYTNSKPFIETTTPNKTASGGNVNAEPIIYSYPLKKIEATDDYLEIRVRQYVPQKITISSQTLAVQTPTGQKLADGNQEIKTEQVGLVDIQSSTEAIAVKKIVPKYTIRLPIPAGLQDSNQVEWGMDRINGIEAMGIASANKVLRSGNWFAGIGGALLDTIKSIEGYALTGGQDLLTNYIATGLVNSLGGNVDPSFLLTRSTGLVLNPNMELLFKSPNLRNFAFNFDMTPRSAAEAERIKKIIRIFKQSMSPKTTANTPNSGKLGLGLFISTPDVFELEYRSGNGTHPFLNRFKTCALVNMGVDYTGAGPYATYDDATPVQIKLALQFSELNPIYYEDYNSDKGQIGVGY